MDLFWISLAVFLVSAAFLVHDHFGRKNEVKAQFVVVGCLLPIFYCVCFLSGICTILNFLWKWVL
jgi:hypothetical protein